MIGAIMIYESKNQNFILLFKFKQCMLCNAVTRPCDVISSLFFHVDWFYVDFINYVGTYRYVSNPSDRVVFTKHTARKTKVNNNNNIILSLIV